MGGTYISMRAYRARVDDYRIYGITNENQIEPSNVP